MTRRRDGDFLTCARFREFGGRLGGRRIVTAGRIFFSSTCAPLPSLRRASFPAFGPGAQPRIADERFKTTESVSRALFALAEAGGKTKQELIHEIVAGWVEEKITAARLLVAFADGEGVPGNAGDCPGNAGV